MGPCVGVIAEDQGKGELAVSDYVASVPLADRNVNTAAMHGGKSNVECIKYMFVDVYLLTALCGFRYILLLLLNAMDSSP